MIIKANQRASGQELATHLLNAEDNEHITVHEGRGFTSDTLHGAFQEVEAISRATNCQQYLFSVSLNPPEDTEVLPEFFEDAASRIEIEFGLIGQPRAIVLHEKFGRLHAHCVWSRIDADELKSVNLPYYKNRMMDIAHDLFIEHGWDVPHGLKHRGEPDLYNYGLPEYQQAKGAQKDVSELKTMFRECWAQADNASAFASALKEQDFVLAKGDRRGYVAVDDTGEVYSLSRWCSVKTKELKARLGDPAQYPSVDDAQRFAMETGRKKKQAQAEQGVDVVYQRQRNAVSRARTKMIAMHRQERQTLLALQKSRAEKEAANRAARFGRGLKAIWQFVTGKRTKIRKQNELEAMLAMQRDKSELHIMRQSQLRQRLALKRQAKLVNEKRHLRHYQHRPSYDGPVLQ